jgi:hypothetical protein
MGKYIVGKFTVRQLSGRERLMANEMTWRRNHMQSHMADCASGKVVQLRIPRGSTSEYTQRILSLISDAAQVISDMEEGAIALQARSEALLVEAIEKLRASDERINFLEIERNATRDYIRETGLKVEDLQSAVDEADSRMKAAGQRMWQAEQHARTSAARAEEAEKAFVQIEEEIRNHLIEKGLAPRRPVAAA